ncbi:MAG: DUF6298 domain-containing protein [Bacteroidota bacterium]
MKKINMYKSGFIVVFCCVCCVCCLNKLQAQRPDLAASNRTIVYDNTFIVSGATGPLKHSPANPDYFEDGNGKPVFLVGSHTWSNFQDMGMEGDKKFDYDQYMQFMVYHHFNFMRFWNWEHAAWAAWSPEKMIVDPMPYLRTGPGLALDGKPKYDLTQFNQAYFDRMRARIIKAGHNGIYASIMLFQAFSGAWLKGGKNFSHDAFAGHYYNTANNIQQLNGDKNNDKVLDIDDPAVRKYEEAYLKKIIDYVWDLDNVLYEVINEGGNPDWDKFVIKTVRAYEKTKGKIHPIGLTGHGAENTEMVLAGDADWISPGPWDKGGFENPYTDPPLWDGKKVSVLDTDHIWGHGIDYHWVWYSFLRGHNVLFMDPWDPIPGWFDPNKNIPDHISYIQGRTAMSNASLLARQIDLSVMKPEKTFESGFCLANKGKEYIIYIRKDVKEIDLSAVPGTFSVEWIHPSENIFLKTTNITGGAKVKLVCPFSDDGIVHLKLISAS